MFWFCHRKNVIKIFGSKENLLPISGQPKLPSELTFN